MSEISKYRMITKEELDAMIRYERKNKSIDALDIGHFLVEDNGVFVAVDTSDGFLNIEDFPDKASALYWLNNSEDYWSEDHLELIENEEEEFKKKSEWIARNHDTIYNKIEETVIPADTQQRYKMNDEKYTIMTKEEFNAMIDSYEVNKRYEPIGSFLMQENGVFVAIDNSDGNANVEEFKTKEEALYWLFNSKVSYSDLYYDKDEDEIKKQAEWIAANYGAEATVETIETPAEEKDAEFIGIAEDDEIGSALLFYHGSNDFAIWYTDDPEDPEAGMTKRGTKADILSNINADRWISDDMKAELVTLLNTFPELEQVSNESYNIKFSFKNGESAQLRNRTFAQAMEAFNELSNQDKVVTPEDAVATVADTLFKSKAVKESLQLTGDLMYNMIVEANQSKVSLLTTFMDTIDLPILLPAGILKNESVKPNGEIHGTYKVDGQAFNIILKADEAWWMKPLKAISISAEAVQPEIESYTPTAIVEAYQSGRAKNIARNVFEGLAKEQDKNKNKDAALKLATLRIWVKQDVKAAIQNAEPLLRDSDQGNRMKKNDDINDGSTIILSYAYRGSDQRDNVDKFNILKNALLGLGFVVNDDTFKRPLDKKWGAVSMTIPGAFEQFSLYGTDLSQYGDTFAGYIVTAELSITKTQASVRLKFSEPKGL